MDKEYIYDLIKEWNNDSKSISRAAERELMEIIKKILDKIYSISNAFGRSYDPNYPSLSLNGDKFDRDCFILTSAFSTRIENIDDEYIYIRYLFNRNNELKLAKVPISILVYFTDDLNIEEYKLRVIDAEKKHLINDIEFKKRALKDAEIKYEKFCEKYFQNN